MTSLDAATILAPIALFGPQATRWTPQSLKDLQSTLQQEVKLAFVVETVADLASVLPLLERIGSTSGISHVRKHITELVDFAQGTSLPDSCALSNAHLATLTIIAQTVELFEKSNGFGRLSDWHAAQGFCTGFLSAAALSLSRSRGDLERYIPIAIRLALCTGFVVDEQDASSEPANRATAVSVRWKSASDRLLLETFLDTSPEIYVSCVPDERTLTVTLPKSLEPSWCARLRDAGFITSLVGLNGAYHSSKNAIAASKLKRLCAGNNRLEFPKASALALPLRSTADSTRITTGALHEVAIDLILCKKAHWYMTVKATQESVVIGRPELVAMGKGSFIPRSCTSPIARSSSEDELPEEIAVVGMACRFPGADSIEKFWDLIHSGSASIGKLPPQRFDPLHTSRGPSLETYWGNFLDRPGVFDHRFFGISGREAKSMDPQQRLALQVAYEAWESSGYCSLPPTKQETDVGCYLGVGSVDYNDNINSEDASAFSATGSLRAFISGRISHHFGWLGPSITFDTACSSSAIAIHTACRALLGGECSVALAGGVSVITSPDLHQNLAAASFLSPSGSSRAFDKDANGYCRGEGVGLLVLKPLSRALADGNNVLGVIAGSAVNQGSNCSSITVPDAGSQSDLYQRALSQSKLNPTEVSFVEAHGTGTQVGDPIEFASVQKALIGQGRAETLFLGSVKDNIGHCEAASGAAGLIKTVLMLQNTTIPKQANFGTINPKIKTLPGDNITIPKTSQPWSSQRRIALVNNYGAAGSNAAIVVREHVRQYARMPTPELPAYPFVLSAKSLRSFQAYARELTAYVYRTSPSLKDLSYNLCRKQNPSLEYRAAFVASDVESLVKGLQDISSKAESLVKRPVVLAFGGQTGRNVAISKQLYECSEIFRDHLDQCDAACAQLQLPSIFPKIFEDEAVEDIVELHCQLLSVQVASAKTWLDLGVEVNTLVGHSFGQISALCVAGSLSLVDAFKFLSGRARLIRDNWGPENGTMLSVDCDDSQLSTLVEQVNSDGKYQVSVACYNGARSFVLSGNEESISKAEESNSQHRMARLNSSHAYHSHLTDDIMQGLAAVAGSIRIQPPRLHVETCSADHTWHDYSPERLAKHTRDPVYFGAAVERIATRLPSAVWLEAGSASPIIGMARRVLRPSNRADDFLPVDISGSATVANLANVATHLWQGGNGNAFWPFDSKARSLHTNLTLPPYQFEDTHHWIQYKPRAKAVDHKHAFEPAGPCERQLVSLLKHNIPSGEALFLVNNSHAMFDQAVRGHAVAGQSLCPASMYLEIAAAGAMIIRDDSTLKSIPHISDMVMSNPLGLDKGSSVFARLQASSGKNVWDFTIFSQLSSNEPMQKEAVPHAKGLISIIAENNVFAETKLQLLRKIARYRRVDRIIASPSATGISGPMVYRLFSSVVDYAGYFQGVKSITALDNEAAGSVTVPTERPHVLSSDLCDPICLDNFLQVAGIHVNCLRARSDAEVFVCTAIEEVILTREFATDRSTSRTWTVYTRFDDDAKGSISNQIFVYDTVSEDLVVAIMGAKFKRVSLRSLARSLSNVNGVKAEINNTKSGPMTRTPSSETYVHESPSEIDSSFSPPNEAYEVPLEKKWRQIETDPSDITPKVRELFSAVIEIPLGEVKPDSTLQFLGIDSLLITEVLSEIKLRFQVTLDQAQIMECENISDVCKLLEPKPLTAAQTRTDTTGKRGEMASSRTEVDISAEIDPVSQQLPGLASIALESFKNVRPLYDVHASTTKFLGYCSDVSPLQSELVVKYVTDAFSALGVDLSSMHAGDEILQIPFEPQHTKLIPQLYLVLCKAGLVEKIDGGYVRTSAAVPSTPTEILHSTMLRKYPQHSSETKLLQTTASKLAECLTGKADPISLIFKDAAARKLLEDVYKNAPMFKTGTLLLIDYLASVMRAVDGTGIVRILELGGGTGGTTSQLVDELAGLHTKQNFTYTFTDLSPSLVVAARRKFAKHSFMEYATLDIEKEPASDLLQKYDIIISTNCIHATKNLIQSTTNIRKMLRPSGILCLIELTRNLFWFDLVFGLLEGWWLFSDNRQHALANETRWEKDLRAAGFNWVDWSDSSSAESDILRVVTGSPAGVCDSPSDPALNPNTSSDKLTNDQDFEHKHTMTFKHVDGLDLEADIYYPPELQSGRRLPIALMIHGGGHIMLSRADIRPEQTQMLIRRGFLPISIDYRLCPEVTLQEGPMKDVADALTWARTTLPNLQLSRPDVQVDGSRVVAVGWSTGGTLAMSLAWNSLPNGTPPPDAILALYCPSDYNDAFWLSSNIPTGSKTAEKSLIELDDATWAGVFDHPIKAYNVPAHKSAVGGWLATTDARSRLALYMNHQGRTLNTILRGLDKSKRDDLGHSEPVTASEIDTISPLAQIRDGNYHTPTFLIHPREDDLIPYTQAERTVNGLKERGVSAQLRILKDVPHLFDVFRNWQQNNAVHRAVTDGYDFLSQHVARRSRQ